MAKPQVPVTNHYPIQLHYIKALFIQGQYRQCIQACRDLLKLAESIDANPLHKTFIHFYLGLCHDEIARLMHHNSVAKLPAFHSAEQYYQDAIDALPSQQEVRFPCDLATLVRDAFHHDDDDDDDETVSDFPISPTMSGYDPRDMGISRASSPILSSPPVFRHEPVLSPPVGSPGTVTSEMDDLESHDSFSELMTPNRVKRDFSRMSMLGQPPKGIPRDASRMSLLDSTPKGLPRDASRMSLLDQPQQATIPREFSKVSLHDPPAVKRIRSPTHSLMRPIRLGSPAKPTFLPPTLPCFDTTYDLSPRLSRPFRATKTEPILAESRVDSRQPSPEPTSPALKTDVSFYDGSGVWPAAPPTPISPQTPIRQTIVTTTSPASTVREDSIDEHILFRLTDHINSMRTQLQRHITLVQDAKERLRRAHDEKRASRIIPPTKGTPLGTIKAKADKGFLSSPATSPPVKAPGNLPQARSYWSFVPEDVKVQEKRKRIAAGRERKWKRERFQPGKYRELCERALEEL